MRISIAPGSRSGSVAMVLTRPATGEVSRSISRPNASLIVAGDFDPAKIKPVVAKLFGTLQKSPPAKRAGLQHALGVIERQFMAHESAKKIQEAYQTRQLAFLRNLLARAADNGTSPAGLLIHDVKLSVRMDMLKNRNVVFAIKRFGQEALNKKTLDTVVVMNPVGQENMLYQIIGRILRKSDGKKQPIALFVEDNVGMIRGMCQKLRKFFRNRAQEDGGPVEITRRSPEARNNLWKDFECSTPASRS